MDDFVKERLTEWSLSDLIPAFEAENIDEDCLFLLDANSLTSLIPQLGPRLKFQHNLKKFLEVLQDFTVLHPESSGKLAENWNPLFSTKIIRMAKKERSVDLLQNIELLPPDKQGDVALQLLPVLLPAAPYKVGRRVFRPSNLEVQKAFIDMQPVGTNMVEYLQNATTEYPYILMLGDRYRCSQAFVILNGTALEQPSLLGAVDGCFKAFFVFDVSYPKSCAQVWEFLQAQLAMMEA